MIIFPMFFDMFILKILLHKDNTEFYDKRRFSSN